MIEFILKDKTLSLPKEKVMSGSEYFRGLLMFHPEMSIIEIEMTSLRFQPIFDYLENRCTVILSFLSPEEQTNLLSDFEYFNIDYIPKPFSWECIEYRSPDERPRHTLSLTNNNQTISSCRVCDAVANTFATTFTVRIDKDPDVISIGFEGEDWVYGKHNYWLINLNQGTRSCSVNKRLYDTEMSEMYTRPFAPVVWKVGDTITFIKKGTMIIVRKNDTNLGVAFNFEDCISASERMRPRIEMIPNLMRSIKTEPTVTMYL